jgi:DNA-binding IclR family transcriptional regulator
VNLSDLKPIKESERQVETVARALEILECFTDAEPELSLKQLSERTGLYKSRILRLCGTLAAHGFLLRLPRASYKLGPKLMSLGKVYERANPLAVISRPVLKQLSKLTGESTKLFVIDGTRRLCLVRETGPSPLHYAINEGQSLELHAGAGGKVLLAYAPQALRQQVLGQSLPRITPLTIVERERLESDFAAIRAQGYAFSSGELVAEVAGLAAPVFDGDNQVCAALTISGPKQHFGAARRQEMITHLLATARQLSFLLGRRAAA